MVLGFPTQHAKETLEILKTAVMDVQVDLEENETELQNHCWVLNPRKNAHLVSPVGMIEKSDLLLLVIGNSDNWTKMVCVQ